MASMHYSKADDVDSHVTKRNTIMAKKFNLDLMRQLGREQSAMQREQREQKHVARLLLEDAAARHKPAIGLSEFMQQHDEIIRRKQLSARQAVQRRFAHLGSSAGRLTDAAAGQIFSTEPGPAPGPSPNPSSYPSRDPHSALAAHPLHLASKPRPLSSSALSLSSAPCSPCSPCSPSSLAVPSVAVCAASLLRNADDGRSRRAAAAPVSGSADRPFVSTFASALHKSASYIR